MDQQHEDGTVQIIVRGCEVAGLAIGILSVLLILCRKKLISSLTKKWKKGSNSMPQPNDSRRVIVNPCYEHAGDSCCDFELETTVAPRMFIPLWTIQELAYPRSKQVVHWRHVMNRSSMTIWALLQVAIQTAQVTQRLESAKFAVTVLQRMTPTIIFT